MEDSKCGDFSPLAPPLPPPMLVVGWNCDSIIITR